MTIEQSRNFYGSGSTITVIPLKLENGAAAGTGAFKKSG